MQVADKKLLITTNDPLLLQMSRITCLNLGESPRGRGAPRWFIFLSNRKKKKENTSLCVEIAPTPFPGYPQIHRRQGALWSLTVRHREAKRQRFKAAFFSYFISYDRAVYTWFMTTFSTFSKSWPVSGASSSSVREFWRKGAVKSATSVRGVSPRQTPGHRAATKRKDRWEVVNITVDYASGQIIIVFLTIKGTRHENSCCICHFHS